MCANGGLFEPLLGEVHLVDRGLCERPVPREDVREVPAVGEPEELNYEIEKAEWFVWGGLPKLPKDQMELLNQVLHDGTRTQD